MAELTTPIKPRRRHSADVSPLSISPNQILFIFIVLSDLSLSILSVADRKVRMTIYILLLLSVVTIRQAWQTPMAVIFTSNELETAPDVIFTYKKARQEACQKKSERVDNRCHQCDDSARVVC
jgi:hypothetical protein